MELYSECCGCDHDNRFTYDWELHTGICVYCLEHATFEEVEDEWARDSRLYIYILSTLGTIWII